MDVDFHCDGCGNAWSGLADQRTCGRCGQPGLPVARLAAPAAPPDRAPLALLAASSLWLIVALSAPANGFTLFVTTGLVLANLALSVRELFARGRPLVALNGLQVGLFIVLAKQVHDVMGAAHYRLAGEVGPGDWAVFVGAHVLRITDVLDFFEAYGLKAQRIEHASVASGLLLIALNLSVVLFLAGALSRVYARVLMAFTAMDWNSIDWLPGREVTRQWRGGLAIGLLLSGGFALIGVVTKNTAMLCIGLLPWALFGGVAAIRLGRLASQQAVARNAPGGAAVLLVPAGVAYLILAWLFGWRPLDWLLWPADNLLRVVDAADVMQVAGVQLHAVPAGPVSGTMALALRLAVGLVVAERVLIADLRWRRGHDVHELAACLRSGDPVVRRLAVERLADHPDRGRAAEPLILRLGDDDPEVRRLARAVVPTLGAAGAAACVDVIRTGIREERDQAVKALRLLGPAAGGAAADLESVLTEPDEAERTGAAVSAVRGLGALGPAALPALRRAAGHPDPAVRDAAEEALAKVSPPAV